LTRSAELRQQAAAENDETRASYLHSAGNVLYWAALEAQQPQPRQQVIDDLLRETREQEDRATNSSSSCTIS